MFSRKIHPCRSTSIFFERSRLRRLRRLLSSSLRCLAGAGILPGFLLLEGFKAARKRSAKRSIAAIRLRAWLRVFCDTTLRTPLLLTRVANCLKIRAFSVADRLSEFATSNQSVTRVLCLLTFCPPGPLLRAAVNFSSLSGKEIFWVIRIIDSATHIPSRPTVTG